MKTALAKAIGVLRDDVCRAIYKLDELSADDGYDPRARDALWRVASLVTVLAHVADGKDVLCALGAPGDWGYGTPLGDALVAALKERATARATIPVGENAVANPASIAAQDSPAAGGLEVSGVTGGRDRQPLPDYPSRTLQMESGRYVPWDDWLDMRCRAAGLEQELELARDLDTLVDRFLSWPLPESVCADPCATRMGYPDRVGTNLLTATEARAMLRHVLGLP